MTSTLASIGPFGTTEVIIIGVLIAGAFILMVKVSRQ